MLSEPKMQVVFIYLVSMCAEARVPEIKDETRGDQIDHMMISMIMFFFERNHNYTI